MARVTCDPVVQRRVASTASLRAWAVESAQGVEGSCYANLPAGVRTSEMNCHHLLNHLHEKGHLGVAAALQVLRGADEDRHVFDAGRLAPGQHALHVFGTVSMADAWVGHAHLAGPSAVSVHDQADVLGQRPRCRLPPQPTGVQGVEEVGGAHRETFRMVSRADRSSWCTAEVGSSRSPAASVVLPGGTRPGTCAVGVRRFTATEYYVSRTTCCVASWERIPKVDHTWRSHAHQRRPDARAVRTGRRAAARVRHQRCHRAGLRSPPRTREPLWSLGPSGGEAAGEAPGGKGPPTPVLPHARRAGAA
uniref:Uncharacterized 32.6 kDa protein in transposon Tn4556 n=1 Tax=Streptomyces fradiae TaxID=1906 RepID=YT32_STRFR|nr:RecName: Full=Uncharacterized 32.6 kDa protein in transposon Tn4556 [Streptomyces fradiae]AAA88566.1 unknown protein [Streptomyces fradiae]